MMNPWYPEYEISHLLWVCFLIWGSVAFCILGGGGVLLGFCNEQGQRKLLCTEPNWTETKREAGAKVSPKYYSPNFRLTKRWRLSQQALSLALRTSTRISNLNDITKMLYGDVSFPLPQSAIARTARNCGRTSSFHFGSVRFDVVFTPRTPTWRRLQLPLAKAERTAPQSFCMDGKVSFLSETLTGNTYLPT